MVCLWLRFSPADADRRRQIVAIAVLIAILFPVISVSDDLMAMQNATETDSCQRRDYLASSSTHTLLPFAAIVTPLTFDLTFASPRFAGGRSLPLPPIELPDRGVAGNRAPPPA